MAQTLEYEKTGSGRPLRGANVSLVLLLLINLFNYIDRSILAAVEPNIRKDFFRDDPNAKTKMGLLATAFLISYMLSAPVLGWLADRYSRWLLIGIGVTIWTLASGGSGLAPTFGLLMLTRVFIGVGEGAYGPAAPTLISDLYPVQRRGSVLAWFYMAIPVGSALGYALGGKIAELLSWRWAFYAVVPPGLLLGLWCFLMRDPPRGHADAVPARTASLADYLPLLRNRSYVLDTLGMAAMTFAIGGIAFWMPAYLSEGRHAGSAAAVNLNFGLILVVSGLTATLAGGFTGDWLRRYWSGSYFLVSGIGMLIAAPLVILMLYVPFPAAWGVIFLAVFFLFFNTGPSNTILANVTHPSIRATAFAVNILVIHIAGDVPAPPLLGWIADRAKAAGAANPWNPAFYLVAAAMVLAGLLWLWGAPHLAADTAAAPATVAGQPT